ncbi:hypothetical protein GCM10009679_59890 [Saccharothrix algeriensis]
MGGCLAGDRPEFRPLGQPDWRESISAVVVVPWACSHPSLARWLAVNDGIARRRQGDELALCVRSPPDVPKA